MSPRIPFSSPERAAWAARYARRLHWAAAARQDLIGRLQDDEVKLLYAHAPDHGAARVAVLGRTQVGKTTLILRLLGLTEPGEKTVGDVLRAGRKQGESASATAAIYGPSGDEHFWYTEPGRPAVPLDRPHLEQKLMELRQRVERGASGATDAVALRFPAPLFRADAPRRPHVIDLPGFGGRDAAEQRLAAELHERYLPNATLVLLVECGNHLASLGFLDVPGAGERWLHFPERYAVVLTRAFSAESVRRRVEANEIGTLGALLEHYRAELHRSLNDALAVEARWDADALGTRLRELSLHPVEIGDSLRAMTQNGREAIKEMVNAALKALDDRVQTASSPMGTLALTAGLWQAAEGVKQRLEQKYEADVGALAVKIKQADDACRQLTALAERHGYERKRAEARLLDVRVVLSALDPSVEVDETPNRDERVATLTKYLNVFADRCRSKARAALARADGDYPGLGLPPDLPTRTGEAFEEKVAETRQLLNRYRVDWYLRKDRNARDADRVERATRAGVEATNALVSTAIGERVAALNAQVEAEIRAARAHERQIAGQMEEERKRREDLEAQGVRRAADHEARLKPVRHDLRIGQQFHAFLRRRFAEAAQAHRRELADPALTGAERLHALASLHLIVREYKQLTAGMQMATTAHDQRSSDSSATDET